MTHFDTPSLDLGAYLRRIDWRGRPRPDLDTLRGLALHHPLAIPFENLNVLLGRPLPLDVPSLQRKLVDERRGGWCFEHNVLLGTALRAIGFEVHGLAARVMWTTPAAVVTPRSHMVLHVTVGGEAYIVDAGFGGLTLTAPLRLEAGIEQATPHERVRLQPAAGVFVLEASVGGEWKALYRFDLQPQAIADYEVTSWYLCTHPRSHFRATLVAARAQPDCRYALRGADFAIHHRDGFTERRPVADAADLRALLEDRFGIAVPAGVEVDGVLERVAAAGNPV